MTTTKVPNKLESNQIQYTDFSETMMGQLKESKCILNYERSDFLFRKGEQAEYIYFVQSGFIQLFRSSLDHKEHSLIVLGAGEWIGYRDALSGGFYQHDARSLRQTTVYRFPNSSLSLAMKENPTFMSVLIQEMIKGWTESEERIYTLNGRRIYERLAEFLLKLEKREFANKEEKSIPIELSLPITRQVLASLLGTTKESIIRALSDFKNRGWIDVYRDKIFLLNKESLIRLVESG